MADGDLFGEDYMFFYADDARDATVERDVDIILRLLDLPSGSSVLEIGCGEGRLLRELARRGYRATGVDRSSKMIEAALAKNFDGAVVDYLIADVREMPAAPRFDGASWYTSFGYEDDAGNLDVLRGIRAQLDQSRLSHTKLTRDAGFRARRRFHDRSPVLRPRDKPNAERQGLYSLERQAREFLAQTLDSIPSPSSANC
jgi:SAM-dependent methyltransferase